MLYFKLFSVCIKFIFYKHNKDIINSMRINVEFALIIILLKKINSGYTFLQKEINVNSFWKWYPKNIKLSL